MIVDEATYREMDRRVAFCLSHALWKAGMEIDEVAQKSGISADRIRSILCADEKDVTLMDVSKLEIALGHEIMTITFGKHQGGRIRDEKTKQPD